VTLFIALAVIVLVAVWRFRPGDDPASSGRGGRWPVARRWLVGLAAVQPAGVVLQAALGGIVVLTNLNPAAVSIHFIASIAILAAAVALYAMSAEPAAPPRAPLRADLRWLSAGLVAVAGLMLAAGTVVTGTGPLAGAPSVPRYRLPLEGVTQMHADIGWLLTGLTIAMVIALRAASPPPAAVRLGWLLLGLIIAQGAIGYSQYFSGLPAGLVWVHVLGATLVWIVVLRLFSALHPGILPALRVDGQGGPGGTPGGTAPGGSGPGGTAPGGSGPGSTGAGSTGSGPQPGAWPGGNEPGAPGGAGAGGV
jgi:heme A synthase